MQEITLPHHFTAQQLHDPNLFSPSIHHDHSSLGSQLDLDPGDPFQFTSQLEQQPHLQHLQSRVPYDQRTPAPSASRFQDVQSSPNRSEQLSNGFNRSNQPGQFGVLTPNHQISNQPQVHHEALGRLQNEIDLRPVAVQDGGTTEGHFSNMKLVPNPPNLEAWRKRLFDVEGVLTMTEEEFQTYFPHVDNIYSHRSTQRYKRKPFVSHYWDCRLKGRPPGTPKSDDPNKKKRKRQARERDLCDVKIKITEYFPGARPTTSDDADGSPTREPSDANNFFAPGQPGSIIQNQQQPRQFPFIAPSDGSVASDGTLRLNQPGCDGNRYYTIQRVNGNGGNGKGDGTAGPHKHTLEENDRIKKNSIHRHLLKVDKEKKKSQSNQKTYHKKASGAALTTVKKHAKEHELKLFGSCFCPFVQRVWISLQFKGIEYQYIEVDPYKKPDYLLAVNPRGLVPCLRHGDWGCYESTVLMEYLEDLNMGSPLLPPDDPKTRAHSRLWTDHVNRHIVPAFYHYLQAQDPPKQIEGAQELQSQIGKLLDAAHPSGPFFLGPQLSYVDVQFAPWIIRMRRVLSHYRGWPRPEEGSRWAAWVDAIEQNEHVKSTTSNDDLYLDSYERYAENRPDTSQVANAVNEGRGLP